MPKFINDDVIDNVDSALESIKYLSDIIKEQEKEIKRLAQQHHLDGDRCETCWKESYKWHKKVIMADVSHIIKELVRGEKTSIDMLRRELLEKIKKDIV